MEPTAFVAGATGYTGRELVRVLAIRKIETHAHVRPDSPRLEEWRNKHAALGAETDATPWELGAMTATMARIRPTHVFSLLGTTRARAKSAEHRGERADYLAVDYGLTVMLIDAIKKARLTPRFVYLSAAGVGPAARGDYLQVRHRVENTLRGSGLSVVIARPSFITGSDRDEDRPVERIAAGTFDVMLGVARAFGARQLQDRYRSTTNQTLARALVRAGFDDSKSGVLESEDLRD